MIYGESDISLDSPDKSLALAVLLVLLRLLEVPPFFDGFLLVGLMAATLSILAVLLPHYQATTVKVVLLQLGHTLMA